MKWVLNYFFGRWIKKERTDYEKEIDGIKRCMHDDAINNRFID